MDMAGEDNIGLMLGDPTRKITIAIVSATRPASGRAEWRPVIDPHPLARTSRRVGGKLDLYCCATCILVLKYSVFLHLNLIEKNLIPVLLIVQAARVLTFSRVNESVLQTE